MKVSTKYVVNRVNFPLKVALIGGFLTVSFKNGFKNSDIQQLVMCVSSSSDSNWH